MEGAEIAEEFVEHFHGNVYTGLIGGAVEVFIRSEGWNSVDGAPRSIPSSESPLPNNIPKAMRTAVVPLMGVEMARAVQVESSVWEKYLQSIRKMQENDPGTVGVFPYLLGDSTITNTKLGRILEPYQRIATSPLQADGETDATLRCRDLTQGIFQILFQDGNTPLTVFISHTNRGMPGTEEKVAELVEIVRQIILNTHLKEFFSVYDLQPGSYWATELQNRATTSALLALRTDLYSSRDWCQKEMAISKRKGMPIVIIDALSSNEERGSFLMDHMPRVPLRQQGGSWHKEDIFKALNLLVDECLKRALWNHQKQLSQSRPDFNISWWAPHAPEPVTFAQWLVNEKESGNQPRGNSIVRIVHPDPPLGLEEVSVLKQMLSISCTGCTLDIVTPRSLATRDG
ncbi:MAG: hypothetical protein OXN23_01190 [Gammaproteobacteria bacterium]|nr:hypothetical protein [Gammaproteobacteria bacterium]